MKTAIKSLSWACVSAIIIGTTAYVESGSLRTALITAAVSALLKTPAYSVHELVHNRFWAKRAEKQGKPVLVAEAA